MDFKISKLRTLPPKEKKKNMVILLWKSQNVFNSPPILRQKKSFKKNQSEFQGGSFSGQKKTSMDFVGMNVENVGFPHAWNTFFKKKHHNLLSRKLTYPLKINVWKMYIIPIEIVPFWWTC